MKIFKKAKRGFTLVELVVVIAVIAILAAVSVGAYFGVTESANNSRLEQETKQIHTALKTVALAGNSNHILNADGLMVNDLDILAEKLTESMGTDISVLEESHSTISVPTIVLHEAEFVKEAANDKAKVYKTFDYLNPEISDRYVNTHAVTGDFKIIKEGFTVDKDADPVTHQDIYIDAPGSTTGVKVYLWNDNTSNGDGQDMEVVSKTLDLFKISVPSYYTHIKFEANTGAWGDMELVLNEETPCYTTTSSNNGTWTAVPEIPTDYNVKDLTVYFTNNFADECFIWAWSIDGINNAEKWPGVDITSSKNEFNLYSYTFERDFLSFKLCSDDKGANESAEISLAGASKETPYYNGNTWVEYPTEAVEKPVPEVKTVYYANKIWDMTDRTMKAYSWVNLAGGAKIENATFPGVAMQASDVADIYQLDIPMACDNIIFTNKNTSDDANGKQTDDISFDGYSEVNSFWNGVEWTEKPTEAPEKPEGTPENYNVKDLTVYFDNTYSWSNVYIYTFDCENNPKNGEWPGTKIQSNRHDGLFEFKFTEDVKTIIFNNGSAGTGNQTVNIDLEGFSEETPLYKDGFVILPDDIDPSVATSIEIKDEISNLILGQKYIFDVLISENATNKNFNITSSDESVIKVLSDGIVALKASTEPIEITVTTADGSNLTDSINLTVDSAKKRVYFQNDWNWTDICLHQWGGSNDGTSWPGTNATNDNKLGLYYVDIEPDRTGIIWNGIKDDGSGNRDQSPNIESDNIKIGGYYKMVWNDGNQFVFTSFN